MNRKERRKIIQENIKRPTVQFRQRSIFIRHLDCGSCNACELELNALTNSVHDIAQYGIHFEASPRHADILAMTGPYTRSLDEAAQLTLDAMPIPRIMSIGDCSKDGGVFKNSYAICDLPEEIKKEIRIHIPGCPPTPSEIMDALLTLTLDNSEETIADKKPDK